MADDTLIVIDELADFQRLFYKKGSKKRKIYILLNIKLIQLNKCGGIECQLLR